MEPRRWVDDPEIQTEIQARPTTGDTEHALARL
jgi:hypothetical protein